MASIALRLTTLLETTGSDPAFLAELIDTYLTDSLVLLADMSQAIVGCRCPAAAPRSAQPQVEQRHLSAHARCPACARSWSSKRRHGILAGAVEHLKAIEAAFDEVQRELRALRPTA